MPEHIRTAEFDVVEAIYAVGDPNQLEPEVREFIASILADILDEEKTVEDVMTQCEFAHVHKNEPPLISFMDQLEAKFRENPIYIEID